MFSKDIDLEIDYNIMKKHNIPILISNKEWKKIFQSVNDKKIEMYKNALTDLLKEEKETNRELIRLKKDKKKNMLKILNLSEEVNSKNNNSYGLELLDQCQQHIVDLNNRIEECRFRTETIPKEIREANFNLLKETIRYSYKELQYNERNLKMVNEEIEELRNRLKSLIGQKHDYEEKVNTIYLFLHGILGNKEMEKLDKDMLE